MPPLNSPGKVVRLDLLFAVGANSRVRDRIFFSYTGAGPTVTDLTTWLGTVSTAYNTNLVPQTNSGTTLTGLQATDLASASGAQTFTLPARVGTLVGTALPAAVAMIIKFKINRRYRGGHPRFYLNGRVTADLATSTTWLSASGSTVGTAFANFIAAVNTTPPTNLGTMAHVNVSYFTGFVNKLFPSGRQRAVPQPRPVPLVDPVQSYSVNLQIGSQRRRSQQSA